MDYQTLKTELLSSLGDTICIGNKAIGFKLLTNVTIAATMSEDAYYLNGMARVEVVHAGKVTSVRKENHSGKITLKEANSFIRDNYVRLEDDRLLVRCNRIDKKGNFK